MGQTLIIGSGISGLVSACYLAKAGVQVTLIEKNDQTGGRARCFYADGFMFDMGPSWYWMPDVFEDFYRDFGKTTSDFYELVKLDPGFRINYGSGSTIQIPADVSKLYPIFEEIEKGSSVQLKKFLKEGQFKYEIGMKTLAYKPALSWTEFARPDVIGGALRSHLFQSMKSYVRKHFKDERLAALMEFPVLFLGAKPEKIPALYSLMNYAALELGTYYPIGGMYKIIEGLTDLAKSLGVKIHTSCEAKKIVVKNNEATGVETSKGFLEADSIIASGDYHHIEQQLLEERYRNYSAQYWNKKTFAPSCLIFYVGVKKKIKGLDHHNLFFDRSFKTHASEIYDDPQWPSEPLFYVCCPSKTDPSVAPHDCENLFILIPIATGLEDNTATREKYFSSVLERLEKECGDSIRTSIVYKKSYCVNDFVKDYNAFKGNAYGLANTLNQTAVLKPSIKNKHIKNLFYSGQLTVPGPGVPPAIISGKISAQQNLNYLKSLLNETTV